MDSSDDGSFEMSFLFFAFLTLSWRVHVATANDFDPILRDESLFEDIELLSIELLLRLDPGHCYTIVTDPLYQAILSAKLFHAIDRIACFTLLVPFNEDLLTPNDAMVSTLQEAIRAGCKCYLIYLANGIQMERFLRFIDQERAIDTQAKLIILHDYRLFVPHMFYIWRRFVNVIFIRQHESWTGRGNFTKASNSFELATVPYPLPIKRIFVTKNLDFWRNGRFRRGGKLISDKTYNLNGQPMRAIVMKHTPAVAVVTNEMNDTIYSGLEVEILRTISQSMNFTATFYQLDDANVEERGMEQLPQQQQLTNESIAGIVEEIVNGEADIALGDLSYTRYHLELMDLSVPYTSHCLTFLTPEALTDNSWKTLILPFSPSLWAGVLFFLFCVGTLFYVLEHLTAWIQRKNQKNHPHPVESKTKVFVLNNGKSFLASKRSKRRKRTTKDIFDGYGDCILLTYSMMLFVSLPKFPRSWPLRCLTGWYWVYCILIVVTYRASLTAILANPAPRVTIDTLEELATSPIACGVWDEQNKEFFAKASDEISQEINEKITIINHVDDVVSRMSHGKFAYYENTHILREIRFKHDQIESNRGKSLHIMSKCAINMPISIGLEKNSPLKPRLDRLLRQIIESGLVGKWLLDSVAPFESSVEEPPQEALMDLKKLYGVIVALAIGFTLAILAFVGELLYWNYVTKKSPLYDKYNLAKLYAPKIRPRVVIVEHRSHQTHHI